MAGKSFAVDYDELDLICELEELDEEDFR